MKRTLHCSFCGKNEHQVSKLVAGGHRPLFRGAAYICDECIRIANEIITDPEPPRAPTSHAIGGMKIHAA